MLNQVIICGRLTHNPEVRERRGKRETIITVAVPRSYKNADGTYDTDFIKCTVWNAIAENMAEYCKKGDIVGVKGRLECQTNRPIKFIAEKVTFLSSKSDSDANA